MKDQLQKLRGDDRLLRRSAVIALLGLVLLIASANRALAQGLSAVGDGRTLWIVQSSSDAKTAEAAPATAATQPSPDTQPADTTQPSPLTQPSIGNRANNALISSLSTSAADADNSPQVIIFNRRESDPAGRIYRLIALRGALANRAALAANDALWMVFKDNSVVSLRYWPNRRASGTLCETRAEPSLPRGAQLLGMTAGPQYVWTLLRVENAATLDVIDRTNPTHLLQRPGKDLPETETPSATTQSVATTSAITAATSVSVPSEMAATQSVRADRLMLLRRNEWTSVPLPTDWPADYSAARIVAPNAVGDWPQLIVEPRQAPGATGVAIWIYRVAMRPDGSCHWERREHSLANFSPVQLSFEATLVEGQIVIAHRAESEKPFDIMLWVLRNDQDSALGKVTIPGDENIGWRLVPSGQSAALVTADATVSTATSPSTGIGTLRWQRMKLTGHLASPQPVALTEGLVDPLSQSADYIVMIAVLVIATFVLLLFWKRDGSQPQIDLPKDMELADLRRLAGGLVDLLPAIFLAAQIYDLDPQQMFASWPGRSGSWQALEPGALALLFYVIHTFLFEILFSRSPGKFIFGLRVVNYQGQRPTPLQIILRNLLKPLDLIAWPLLLMPLLGTYRQRLCDLVARTLVVVPPDPTDEEENERDDHDDHDA